MNRMFGQPSIHHIFTPKKRFHVQSICTVVYRRCSLVWNHVANGRPVFSEELLLLGCKVWRILSINDSNAKCIDPAKSKELDHNGQGHYLHDIEREAMDLR